MFIKWVTNLIESIQRSRAYGSELEEYIVRNQPKDSGDVERLTREFNQRLSMNQWSGSSC